MNGLVYVFPGQGSQRVGMGRAMSAQFEPARVLFQAADDLLGFEISRLCFEGPADVLTDTVNAQPAILVTSLAMLAAARAAGAPEPACVAGHSLGHFSALVAAGALEFAAAVRMVRLRGELMKAAAQSHRGGMAAVIRLDAARLADICAQAARETGQYVGVANDNAPDQIVISGEVDALERASALAKEAGARRVVPLAVSVAAHTPLLAGAAEAMARHLRDVPVKAPKIPVISNVTAAPLGTGEEIKADIVRQLTSPVRWTGSVQAMAGRGGATFVEIGPGSVLAGLIKRILPAAEAWSLDELEGLAKLLGLARP